MASGKITKRSVDAFTPGAADRFLWDDELRGFGLKVTPGGRQSYIYQYRLGGRETKTRRWTIGGHGNPWTAATARTEAERLARLVGQGIDPVEDEKKRRSDARTLAFDAYVETFADGYLATEWGSSWRDAKRQLEMHVVPVLGSARLDEIGVSDLNGVFDPLRSRPALQRNVYAVTRKLFAWAEKRDDIAASPFRKMDVPSGAKARRRILSPDELVALWQASFHLDGPRGSFIRLLMTTLQRRSEVAEAPWAEFEQGKAVWQLPPERTKNGQTHIVPLSTASAEVLAGIGWRKRGLLFPSSTGKTPISNFSDIKTSLDAKMRVLLQKVADERAAAAGEERLTVELPDWRLHDIRRTGTTQLQQLGFPIEVTERVINHHTGGTVGGIRGVYNLWEYVPEKARALEAWAGWLQSQIDGAELASNVVPITAAAGL